MRYRTIDNLLEAHPAGGVAFFMRHAERYPIDDAHDVIHSDLTENGFLAAHHFGERLGAALPIGLISSSPLARCRNTCRAILEGAGQTKRVHGYWWLFSPNLRARGAAAKNGRVKGVQFWSGSVQDGPKSIYLTERMALLSRRIRTPSQAGEIYLYVAHDTTVLPLLAYLLGCERTEADQMPDYLEGIALVHRDGRLALDDPGFYSDP